MNLMHSSISAYTIAWGLGLGFEIVEDTWLYTKSLMLLNVCLKHHSASGLGIGFKKHVAVYRWT